LALGAIFSADILNLRVIASSGKLKDSSLSVTLNEESAQLKYTLNYSEYIQKQIIDKISIKFPYKELKNLTITSNSAIVPYLIKDEQEFKLIEVNLGQASANFQFAPQLEITFSTNQVKYNYPKGFFMYIPYFSSDFDIQEMNYQINFPESFSQPSEVYMSYTGLSNKHIAGVTNGGLLAFWNQGKSIRGEISAKVIDSDKPSLFNLPSENNYEIYYEKNPEFIYGLADSFKNHYGVMNHMSDIDISFIASDIEPGNITINNFYKEFINIQTSDSADIIEDSKQFESIIDKMKFLSSYVVNKLGPLLIEETDLTLIDNLGNRIESNSKLTSFEYCYFLSSLAQEVGVKMKIAYGYSFFNTSSNTYSPHIWCEYIADNKTYISDPWMEDVYKLVFSAKTRTDRFIYGYWNPDIKENNLLGVVSTSENLQIKLSTVEISKVDGVNEFNTTFPSTLKSGVENEVSFTFKSDQFFKIIQGLEINRQALDLAVGHYTLAIAPNSNNSFKLNFNPGNFVIYLPQYAFESRIKTYKAEFIDAKYINLSPDANLSLSLLSVSLLTSALTLSYFFRERLKRLLNKVKSKYTGMRQINSN